MSKHLWLVASMLGLLNFCCTVSAATIAGRVVDEITSAPLAGIDVVIYDQDWTTLSYSPLTDQNGEYQIDDLPPGLYYLKVDPCYPQHYRQEYWRNSYTRSGASQIALAVGQTIDTIDFQLSPGAYLGGRVRSSELSQPLPNISIQVYNSTWQVSEESAKTDDLGFFYVGGLASGNYYIKANPIYPQPYIDQYWDHAKGPNTAQAVTLTIPNDILDVNFDLDVGGYIVGTVLDSQTLAPVPDILIQGFNSSWSKMRIQDHTDRNGLYVLGAWEAGLYYVKTTISYPEPYLSEYFSGAYQKQDAVPITITPPNNVGGIDFQLEPGAYILGTVVDDLDGLPVPDIGVVLYDSAWNLLEPTAQTNSLGQYILGPVPSGSYYLAAPADETAYHQRYWENSDTKAQAKLLTITAPTNQYSKDFSLFPINIEPLTVTLELPATIYYPGDTFYLNTVVFNRSQAIGPAPLFVILQVTDYFYFWPSWGLYHSPESITIDFERKTFQPGQQSFTIIEPFQWPVVDEALYGIGWYGVVMNQSFTLPISNLAYVEWGYSP